MENPKELSDDDLVKAVRARLNAVSERGFTAENPVKLYGELLFRFSAISLELDTRIAIDEGEPT